MHVLFFLAASTIPFHVFAPKDYRKDCNVKDKSYIHSICVFVSHAPTHKHKYMYEKRSTIHGFYKKRYSKNVENCKYDGTRQH